MKLAETEMKFEIAADPDAVAAFLSAPENVGRMMPFVDHTDGNGHWILKDQQSRVTQTKKLVPALTVESGGVIEWVGKGERLTAALRFVLSRQEGCTAVDASLRMEIDGALGVVLGPIISLNIRNQIEAIARALKEEFDGSSAGVACHACPICGKG